MSQAFVDIHCHLLPGIDDGAASMAEAQAMAAMARSDGTAAVICTAHQLGRYAHNLGEDIRRQTATLQEHLTAAGIDLAVLPGADVRIEEGMIDMLARGDVLTLADRGRHVLLELPHELYFPIEGLLESLRQRSIVGILSHPERNAGLLRQPPMVARLVDAGCLMQVTAGSLMGTFGPASQQMAEWMLAEGLVHFMATDAHGVRARRPLMRRAFDRVGELTDDATARSLCCDFPARVAAGLEVACGRQVVARKPSGWRALFARKAA